jgi:prophage antirepressor-like protein
VGFDHKLSMVYTSHVSAKKALIGCASPLEFAARSRNRTVCGFFHGTSYGGAVGRGASSCRSSLREFPGLAHPAALPPDVQVGRQSFNGTLESIMADLFAGASAQITPFNFNTHAVRVIQRDGAPWFVASDICEALGYANSRKAVADHLDDDEKGVTIGDTLGGKQALTIINESGLYALVLRSRKPEARKFAKWVTSEVLPAIRKTGGYQPPVDTAQALAAANAVAAQVQAAVFEQLTSGSGCIEHGRWMVSFSFDRDKKSVPCVHPRSVTIFVRYKGDVLSLKECSQLLGESYQVARRKFMQGKAPFVSASVEVISSER